VLSEVRLVTLYGWPMTRSQKSGSVARISPAKGSSRANPWIAMSLRIILQSRSAPASAHLFNPVRVPEEPVRAN